MNEINRETKSKLWYVIYVRSKYGKHVHLALVNRGIISSLPTKSVFRQWSDRKKKVQIPMFRGYVFVKINLKIDKLNVLQTPGVVKFINFNYQIPAIPKEQMFWLNTLLRSESEINYESQYQLGVEVEVITGPFKGLKGNVIKSKSALRVALWIDIIMQGVSIEIDSACLSMPLKSNNHLIHVKNDQKALCN